MTNDHLKEIIPRSLVAQQKKEERRRVLEVGWRWRKAIYKRFLQKVTNPKSKALHQMVSISLHCVVKRWESLNCLIRHVRVIPCLAKNSVSRP
jgi:hypothetical protein